ncbi:hypothetical protein [Phycicoccus avicenniae]|uniref:hypothetical protein n=1 Tax=Phycicoccus avicenniae TaxID=2828860 RepID=UPI003D2CC539
MSDTQQTKRPIYATCPLPHCDADLGIEVSAWDPIDDRPGAHLPDAQHPRYGYWKLTCEQGHVVDEGAHEADGRSALVGHRVGQVLGGVR